MARPKTKQELLLLSQKNFDQLNDYINQLSTEEQQTAFRPGTLNRNIRDVLAHLYQWHLMMLEWYDVGMQEQKPNIPALGYSWKTVPLLNRKIWEQNLDRTLEQIRSQLEGSHLRVREVIEKHSDEELFEKKRYHWTGTTSLGAYLISATSSHYDWALKLIKKGLKSK